MKIQALAPRFFFKLMKNEAVFVFGTERRGKMASEVVHMILRVPICAGIGVIVGFFTFFVWICTMPKGQSQADRAQEGTYFVSLAAICAAVLRFMLPGSWATSVSFLLTLTGFITLCILQGRKQASLFFVIVTFCVPFIGLTLFLSNTLNL